MTLVYEIMYIAECAPFRFGYEIEDADTKKSMSANVGITVADAECGAFNECVRLCMGGERRP